MTMLAFHSRYRTLIGVATVFAAIQGCVQMTEPDPSACTTDAECDDDVFCDGSESCVDGECVAGNPPCPIDQPCIECDEDRDACTVSECVADVDCDDGQFCNGSERCSNCVCEPGNTPCGENETCNEDVNECEAVPAPLLVVCSIDRLDPSTPIDPCSEISSGSAYALTSAVQNARGTLTFAWTASQGTLDDPNLPNPTLTLGLSAAGSLAVTLVVTDTFVSEGNTMTVNASCEQNILIPFALLPPNDQILFPVAADFIGGTPFSQGASLLSGQSSGSVPALIANVNRGSQDDVSVVWELARVPAAGRLEDVTILNPNSLVMNYRISPNPEAKVPTITSAGQLVPVSNVVVPGTYTFRVTVTDLICGDIHQDEVSHILIPGFKMLGPGD